MLKTLVSRAVKLVRRDEEGATLAEYGLLVALIAVACTAGVAAFGTTLNQFFVDLFARLTLTGA